MRVGLIATGILLIICAVADQALMPKILAKVATLTDNLETSLFSKGIVPTKSSPVNLSQIPLGTTPLMGDISPMMGTIEKLSIFASWVTIIVGGIYVVYGIFAANNNQICIMNKVNKPFEILKKRLAKGEITKKEFDELKYDVL